MPSWKAFTIISLLVVLTACSGDSSNSDANTPVIGKIYTDINHQHSSFYNKWNITPNRTIRFTFSAQVTDPQGINNLKEIYVENLNNNWTWYLLGNFNNCYVEAGGVFECTFYSDIQLDSINLNNWVLVAKDQDDNITRKNFSFLLPGGSQANNESFVYSSAYSDSNYNGIAALEAMTLSNNNLVFTSNPGTRSFHIEFETTDERAVHYSFAFYEGSNQKNYVGEACLCSPSIESMPIIFGQKVVIDLPWSEISLDQATYDVEDINGLHIKLYDQPIDWITPNYEGIWFNYISYSEYISLAP